jgi:hypothetical protein
MFLIALDPEYHFGGAGGGRQQSHVNAGAGDMLFEDQAMLCIDCHLRIVADGHLTMAEHSARIGIVKRDLPFHQIPAAATPRGYFPHITDWV